MKIIIGKKSGFCNGVKYTIDQATKTINENENMQNVYVNTENIFH